LVNEGGVANVQTLSATDVIDGGAGTDSLVVSYNTAVTPFSITNVENITLTDQNALTEIIDLVNVTGMTSLTLLANAAAADINNVANIVTLNLTNNAQSADIDYAAAAVAGAADAQVVNLSSNTAGTLTLDTGIETVTINSVGGVANTLTALAATGVTAVTITGAQDLTITNTLGTTVTSVDASTATGAVSLVQSGAQISNIVTGAGADVINLAGGFVDLTTAATADTVNGGAGVDRLILNAAEAAAVTAAAQFANITNIEQIVIADDATGVTLNTIFLGGASQLEFDGLVCQRQSKSEPKGSAKCCHFGVGIISV
jgi:hypothetical protein